MNSLQKRGKKQQRRKKEHTTNNYIFILLITLMYAIEHAFDMLHFLCRFSLPIACLIANRMEMTYNGKNVVILH